MNQTTMEKPDDISIEVKNSLIYRMNQTTCQWENCGKKPMKLPDSNFSDYCRRHKKIIDEKPNECQQVKKNGGFVCGKRCENDYCKLHQNIIDKNPNLCKKVKRNGIVCGKRCEDDYCNIYN